MQMWLLAFKRSAVIVITFLTYFCIFGRWCSEGLIGFVFVYQASTHLLWRTTLANALWQLISKSLTCQDPSGTLLLIISLQIRVLCRGTHLQRTEEVR